MDWTTQSPDDNSENHEVPSAHQIPETHEVPLGDVPEAPGFARATRDNRVSFSLSRTTILLAGGLVLVAAVGGSGFIIGHYVGRPSTTSALGSALPQTEFPSGGSFGNFFGGASGSSGSTGSSGTTVTPSTLPANAPSAAAAAKIAAKVDVGVVDITTNESYSSSSAAGTGMILSSNGLVLTNNHVIDGATSISVRDVATNATYSAKVLGYSVTKDVALLQLNGASGLSTVTTANSSAVKASEAVVGVGNAGGVGGTPSYEIGRAHV